MAAEWVTDALQRYWGLAVTGCEQLVISWWNALAWVTAGDRRLIAKWSALPQFFAHLVDAASVAAWLGPRGIPVAAPIPAIDGSVLVEMDNNVEGGVSQRLPGPGSRFLLGVIPVVDGDLLDVTDPAQVVEAGRMLAMVHDVLAAYLDPFGGRRPIGREQLVHNDFRSANILHDGTRITAVLDLEDVTFGTRVPDLAKSAVFLGTRYRNWGPTSEDVRNTFIASYTDHTHLTSAERQELRERIGGILKEKEWE